VIKNWYKKANLNFGDSYDAEQDTLASYIQRRRGHDRQLALRIAKNILENMGGARGIIQRGELNEETLDMMMMLSSGPI